MTDVMETLQSLVMHPSAYCDDHNYNSFSFLRSKLYMALEGLRPPRDMDTPSTVWIPEHSYYVDMPARFLMGITYTRPTAVSANMELCDIWYGPQKTTLITRFGWCMARCGGNTYNQYAYYGEPLGGHYLLFQAGGPMRGFRDSVCFMLHVSQPSITNFTLSKEECILTFCGNLLGSVKGSDA